MNTKAQSNNALYKSQPCGPRQGGAAPAPANSSQKSQ